VEYRARTAYSSFVKSACITVASGRNSDAQVRLDCRLIRPPQIDEAWLQEHLSALSRNFLQTIVEWTRGLVGQIARYDQR
jgi:hypothetical protein